MFPALALSRRFRFNTFNRVSPALWSRCCCGTFVVKLFDNNMRNVIICHDCKLEPVLVCGRNVEGK
jgi:hypothetical protein